MKICLIFAMAILAIGCGLARAESLNGLYSYLEYQKVTAKYPANARLNGRYTAGSGSAGILSAKTLLFNTDGTFTTESVGSVRSSAGSAISSSADHGAYRLSWHRIQI